MNWLVKKIWDEKLNNPVGFMLLGAIMAAFAYFTALDFKMSALALGGIIGTILLIATVTNPMLGITTTLFVSFIVPWVFKFTSAPIGLSLDALLFLLLFGLLIRQIKERDWSFVKNPISSVVWMWIYINLLEVLNPSAESLMAWVFTVRHMAGQIGLYFIAAYAFSSLERIKFTIKVIIGLCAFAGFYGIKQEVMGFTEGELAWLYADKERFQLIFQWSRLRILSILADPTVFGILMGFMAVFCFILATGPFKLYKRVLLLIAAFAMLLSMAYSGTRTAFVLVPLGIGMFAVVSMNRFILMGTAIFLLLGSVLILKSTSNPVLFRIQSAFRPNKSDSMQVRYKNQKMIQPFIHSHPIGAGLGSVGAWGKRFTPDSFLAKFPPDSGFVRNAVEMGWIGLLIFCIFLFVIFKQTLYYYYRVKDPEIKVFYLALVVVVFLLSVASYPQETIPQLPISIVFYVLLAAIVRLKDFDRAYMSEYEPERLEQLDYEARKNQEEEEPMTIASQELITPAVTYIERFNV
jgi:putative inorganic carbon (hco3(-)) transporter